MFDENDYKRRENEFNEILTGIDDVTDDPVLQLFGTALAYASRGIKEYVVDKINQEKSKERINDKLAILEYAESMKNKRNVYTPNEAEEDRLVDQIKHNDPDFNKELFEHYAGDIFRKLMNAFCENTLDSLRKYIDVNILELLKIQASKNASLKVKEEMIIKQVNYVDFFGFHNEGNLEVISVALGVNYYDFAKDKEGNIIKGSDKIMVRSVYFLSFARKAGSKTINNIKDYRDGIAYCPNCGGKIVNSYSECEYCHTVLYNGTDNWLLTHIEEMK